jgi:Na+-driven multidrug efflux pump
MMAGASMIGQNLGAGKIDRAKRTVHFSVLTSIASATFFVLIFHFFPTEIYSLFTSDPAVLEMAPMFMFVLALTIPATSIMCPFMAFIQGIGNAELSFFIAILDGFFTRILLSLLLVKVFNLGILGWFLGYGLAAYVTLFLSAGYFYSNIWKKRKLLV